jgi:DMSO/TMAO reductase YedYZ molybdopterin-dependent catalytic subunit
MKRRDFVRASAIVLPCAPLIARAATVAPSADQAIAQAPELQALPGKKPLLRRSFRPPNFETPLAGLRSLYTPNDLFFVRYHLAVIPEVDRNAWRLRVGGESAQRTLELSLRDLRDRYRSVTLPAVNQCSGNRRGLFTPRVPGVQWGNGAIGNAAWTGVRLRDVLADAGVKPGALEVVLDGADAPVIPQTPDFVKSLPMEKATDPTVLIAFEMNGKPLPHWNGAPARLIVPGWTATYWVKHLTQIRVQRTAFDGFWMKSSYRVPAGVFPGARFMSQEAADTAPITEILVNSLITSHVDGERVPRGRTATLRGWAWDGGSGIARVEVSFDAGAQWRDAELGNDVGNFSWREFRVPLDTRVAGTIRLTVRAHARSGAVQPNALTPNPSGYHHNMTPSISLEVVA